MTNFVNTSAASAAVTVTAASANGAGIGKTKTTTISGGLLYGTLDWAMTRARASSVVYPDVFFLVFAVGAGARDFRFTRQVVGTRTPGRVFPIASFREGREVTNEVPVTPKKEVGHKLEPLTIPLPWDPEWHWKEIKSAFRVWCKTGHPDVGGSADIFRAVEQRYRLAEENYHEELRRANHA